MKQKALLVCVGAVACAMTAFNAQGQSIEAKLTSISPALTVNGTFNNGGTTKNYTSGVNNLTTTSSGGFDFEAFCVEPTAFISVGQTLTYEVTNTSLLTNSDKVARLVGAFLGSSKTNADAAAIQWAIWEVTSDSASSTSLSDGNVQISDSSASTRTLGNQYLANINTFDSAEIYYLTNSKYQNMVAFKPGGAVPEPATFGLVALSSILLLRRKRS